MRSLGPNPTDTEINEMVAAVDPDRTGEITFPEFLRIMQQLIGRKVQPAHL